MKSQWSTYLLMIRKITYSRTLTYSSMDRQTTGMPIDTPVAAIVLIHPYVGVRLLLENDLWHLIFAWHSKYGSGQFSRWWIVLWRFLLLFYLEPIARKLLFLFWSAMVYVKIRDPSTIITLLAFASFKTKGMGLASSWYHMKNPAYQWLHKGKGCEIGEK